MSESNTGNGEINVRAAEILPVADGLWLETWHEGEADLFYATIQSNKDFLARTQPDLANQTEAETHAMMGVLLGRIAQGVTAGYKIMRQTETGPQVFGAMNLYGRKDATAGMAYWLIEAAQGQGIARRCGAVLTQYGFNEWNLDTIRLDINPLNSRSTGLALRLGANDTGKHTDHGEKIYEIKKHA